MGCKCLFNAVVTLVSHPFLSGAQKEWDEKCKLKEKWAGSWGGELSEWFKCGSVPSRPF